MLRHRLIVNRTIKHVIVRIITSLLFLICLICKGYTFVKQLTYNYYLILRRNGFCKSTMILNWKVHINNVCSESNEYLAQRRRNFEKAL